MDDAQVFRDAIGVMQQGGQQIAEEAIEKWWSGKYHGNTEEMMKHWKAVHRKIAELCRELKR